MLSFGPGPRAVDWGALICKRLMIRRDHVFDGQILNRDKPDYQLCDIEDPLLKRYINDERLITDTCDVSPCLVDSITSLHFSSKI